MTTDTKIPDIPPAMETATSTSLPATEDAQTLVGTSERTVEVGKLEASLSAIASAKTGSLDATGSAIGMANVAGDSDMKLSVAALVNAKGDASFHQSYASAFIAGKDVSVSQGGSPVVIARTITFEQAGSLVAVASSASVRRGFVGLLLSGDADISEDSKVLMTGRSVLILAAAVLGGFAFVAIAMAYSASQVTSWRPNISLPSWAQRNR